MRLEDLYTNFVTLSGEEQSSFVASYRLRRAADLEKILVKKGKKKASSESKKIILSAEEELVAKALGLKPKDILALRSMQNIDIIEEENDEELLVDNTFELEDEE